MEDYVVYIALSFIVTVLIVFLSFTKRKKVVEAPEENEEVQVRARPRPLPLGEGIGARNRAAANRNARARMRVAEAQRQQQQQPHHSDSENEIEELGEEIALPDGKIGKKKLAKLQLKAEKRATREADEREREEKKEREELKAEQKRELEKEIEEEEKRKEEEERLKREEEESREQEEYEKLKVQFEVEGEGFDVDLDEDKQTNLYKEFLDYIQRNKVVVLEELAALFKLKTQAVIDRITELQKNGTLTGVIDDRGKFIYISQTELESVATFIRQRGRVSIIDLAEASNSLINLNPETAVKA